MESLRKEQLNPTSSVNFLETLPDVLFYAVIEKLPARVIENTVRLLSRDCYRRVELRRARLPRVCFNWLGVFRNEFSYRFGTITSYKETIDPTNLMHHLEYLAKRVTFKRLVLWDVDWEVFANCKELFRCEELYCDIEETTLSPERFMDVFCRTRPTRQLTIFVNGDKQNVPVTSDFFTNNHAVGLQNVRFDVGGKAMVDPLNDTSVKLMKLTFEQLVGKQNSKISCATYLDCQLDVDARVDASAPGSIGIYMVRLVPGPGSWLILEVFLLKAVFCSLWICNVF
ncbi:unnamed protein product, partial [Mesorhabditis belari]|uniref:F-box domain-containing protein n=1 Tax=Mesorhabditis belari TaxID=2138241 RepID=A0AAF3ES49_9BILA